MPSRRILLRANGAEALTALAETWGGEGEAAGVAAISAAAELGDRARLPPLLLGGVCVREVLLQGVRQSCSEHTNHQICNCCDDGYGNRIG